MNPPLPAEPAMADPLVEAVLGSLGVEAVRVDQIPGATQAGNANWHVWMGGGGRSVLRRYFDGMTAPALEYEQQVVVHAAEAGWTVPVPLGAPVTYGGRWWCLTTYVGGGPRVAEDSGERDQRGRLMARLDHDLYPLASHLGQREGWTAAHQRIGPFLGSTWRASLVDLAGVSLRHHDWILAAVDTTEAALAAVGCRDLPLTVVHGDLASWNIHFEDGALSGVIDFALTHLDSRPHELAMARVYRAPETLDAYRQEVAELGWPLDELEEASIDPIYRRFRVSMAAWAVHDGGRHGEFDLDLIESQLERTGVPAP